MMKLVTKILFFWRSSVKLERGRGETHETNLAMHYIIPPWSLEYIPIAEVECTWAWSLTIAPHAIINASILKDQTALHNNLLSGFWFLILQMKQISPEIELSEHSGAIAKYLPFWQTSLAPPPVDASPVLHFHNRTPLLWWISLSFLCENRNQNRNRSTNLNDIEESFLITRKKEEKVKYFRFMVACKYLSEIMVSLSKITVIQIKEFQLRKKLKTKDNACPLNCFYFFRKSVYKELVFHYLSLHGDVTKHGLNVR